MEKARDVKNTSQSERPSRNRLAAALFQTEHAARLALSRDRNAILECWPGVAGFAKQNLFRSGKRDCGGVDKEEDSI